MHVSYFHNSIPTTLSYIDIHAYYCARHEKWQRFTVRKEEFTFQNRRPVFLAKLIPVKCRIPKGIAKLHIILHSSVGSTHV